AAALITIATGVVPALVTSKPGASLTVATRSAAARPHRRIVNCLVSGEMALAFVLTLSMALLGGSYWRLLRVNPGFNAQNVLTLSLLPDGAHYPTQARRLAYFDAVVDRTEAIPGVVGAGYASTLPLSHPSTTQ